MKKATLKIIAILVIIVVFTLPKNKAFAAEQYIYDGANLINPQEQQKISEIGQKIESSTGVKIIIATADNQGDEAGMKFKTQTMIDLLNLEKYQDYAILLVDKHKVIEHKPGRVFITYSQKFDSVLNNEVYKDITVNKVYPLFRIKDYSNGCLNYYASIADIVDKYYGLHNEYDKFIVKPGFRLSFDVQSDLKALGFIWLLTFIIIWGAMQSNTDELIDENIISLSEESEGSGGIYELPLCRNSWLL